MPSVADRSSAASSSSPGRRMLSRLTSPFATKSRSITDFYIQPDDPHKQYSPGDIVTGSVRLRVLRPTRVTHIVVSLHGYAQVFKNPGSPGEGFRSTPGYLGTGRGKKTAEYFGNGFASLFEDELVLCGDGRLAEGAYQFNFELEFPDTDLPSSIDFERGTVTYMISATVTRPTTISPTLSCDRKIYFVERIDISPLYPPKSRTITLEPVSRRKVAKDQARKLVDPADRKSRKTDSASRSDPKRNSNSTAPSTRADSEPPMSPSPSHMSFESAVSGSNGVSQHDSSSQSQSTSTNTRPNDSKGSVAVKCITTEVESCVGGCLRGDSIPVKVSVNHVKHIKSMNGVIVTLYRQARVDMHPAIPLGPTEKSANPKYEDYYPRSKTGLGGLSLSGAGSSHMFRKDLSQTVQPLIVDPGSLLSEVTVRVRVPEDAFPTISTVPGAMISFKYYVEVVVDIQGRLGPQERAMAGLTGSTSTAMSGGDDLEERGGLSATGAQMVDTAPVRRDKGVVTATFEVVIGTRDSERRKGKQKEEEKPVASQEPPAAEPTPYNGTAAGEGDRPYSSHPSEDDYWGYNYHDWSYGNGHGYDQWDYYGGEWDQSHQVPMPHVPDDSHLSEKERARRAEERLLPSQPPGIDQAIEGAHAPTAPYLPGEHVPNAYSMPTPAYESRLPSPSAPSESNLQTPHGDMNSPAPEYFPVAGPSNHVSISAPVDDKQDMHRRQLEAQASAPPLESDDEDLYADSNVPSSNARNHRPSASDVPSMPDRISPDEDVDDTIVPSESDLIHDSHADAGALDLPRYEPTSPPPIQGQQSGSDESNRTTIVPDAAAVERNGTEGNPATQHEPVEERTPTSDPTAFPHKSTAASETR